MTKQENETIRKQLDSMQNYARDGKPIDLEVYLDLAITLAIAEGR